MKERGSKTKKRGARKDGMTVNDVEKEEQRGGGEVGARWRGGQMNGSGGGLEINRQQKVGTEPPAAGEPEQRSRRAESSKSSLRPSQHLHSRRRRRPRGRHVPFKTGGEQMSVSVAQEHQSEHVSVSSDKGSRYSSASPQDVMFPV